MDHYVLRFDWPACGQTMEAYLGERGRVKRCKCGWIFTVPIQPMPFWMGTLFRVREVYRKMRRVLIDR